VATVGVALVGVPLADKKVQQQQQQQQQQPVARASELQLRKHTLKINVKKCQ